MRERLELKVAGMTCGGCENAVKRTLMKLNGITSVAASHTGQSVTVDYDPGSVTLDSIRSAINALGYQVLS